MEDRTIKDITMEAKAIEDKTRWKIEQGGNVQST